MIVHAVGKGKPFLSQISPDRADSRGHRPLILASASPRRFALLQLLGQAFAVRAVDIDETPRPGESASDLAARLASAKAVAASSVAAGAPTLGADTVVALDESALGKPLDTNDAWQMLRRLRGRSHHVVTAVALAGNGSVRASRLTRTEVAMRDYSDAEIERYVARREPFDKAGAYAIQDNEFRPVQRIDGCYPNVVGLPLCATAALLGSMLGNSLGNGDVADPSACGFCRQARDLFGQG
jgi:septum formation protein